MMTFLYLLTGAVMILIPTLLLFLIIAYSSDIDGIKDFISFKQFKSFYEINPDRWELRDCVVECRNPGYLTRNIRFKFHFIDYLRYVRYKRVVDKNKNICASNERYKKMIELVKSDLADFEQRTKKETQDKLNEIWKNSKTR